MIDYKIAGMHDLVLQKNPDITILTGSNFMLSKPDTRMVFQPEMDLDRKLDQPFLGICFVHQLIGAVYASEVEEFVHNVREFKEIRLIGKEDPILYARLS